MKKKILAMVAAVAVMSSIMVPGVFADSANRGNSDKEQVQTVEKGNGNSGGNVEVQQEKEAKVKPEVDKAAPESQKAAVDGVEKQLKKETQDEMKAAIRSTYTSEELTNIDELAEKIKKEHKGITVMPVDSIIAKGRAIKFDTPPVIKDGRTLIPVRALSEAFGATVAWDPVERKVTISNGTTEIILNLDSNTAFVNGTEVTLDVAPTSLNSRTIVPLRFITENLGLKVNWDDETETVEIEDGTTPTTETTPTTGTTPTTETTPATGTTPTTETTPTTGTTPTTETTPTTGTTPTTETTPTTGTTPSTETTPTETTSTTTGQ